MANISARPKVKEVVSYKNGKTEYNGSFNSLFKILLLSYSFRIIITLLSILLALVKAPAIIQLFCKKQ